MQKLARLNSEHFLNALRTIDFTLMFPPEEFPEFSKREEHTTIHRLFHDIFINLKENHYVENIDKLQTATENWRRSFLKVYHPKELTPYMHLFVSHMCYLVKLHGDVDVFNIQGLEKLNDQTSTEYFRASNKQR